MDSTRIFEQALSPAPEDVADEDVADEEVADEDVLDYNPDAQSTMSATPAAEKFIADTRSATPATPAAETGPVPAKPDKVKAADGVKEMRRVDRGRITSSIRKWIRSEKSSMIDRKDRADMLYDRMEHCLAVLKRDGKATMRERFPSEWNEQEESSRIVKIFSDYIAGDSTQSQASKSVKGSKSESLRRDVARTEDADQDDEEPVPAKWTNKGVKQEAGDDLADGYALLKSGEFALVASVAIARGFGDARLAVDSKQTLSARTWKYIGGRWIPVPAFSPKTASGSVKRSRRVWIEQ